MKKYQFEDFKMDKDDRSLIADGEHGMKLQMSIFNPLVPEHYKSKAVDALNGFIANNNVTVANTDSLAVMLEAYIQQNVDADKKYRIVIYLWNEAERNTKDYVICVPILPTEEHFAEFEQCIMSELRYLTLGK